MLRQLWNDELCAIISAELVLVMTILVLGTIVGLSEVSVAVVTELNDVGHAIGSLSQSFAFTGFHSQGDGKKKSFFSGSKNIDYHDTCDCNQSCDIVCGPPSWPTCG
jgi:hypothetical protein